MATLLVAGEVGPDQVEGGALTDERIIRMAGKVSIEEDPRFTRLYEMAVRGEPGGKHVAEVEIRTLSGDLYRSGTVEGNIKYPPDNWDVNRIETKFKRVVGHALPWEKVNEVLGWVKELSEAGDLRDHSRLLDL